MEMLYQSQVQQRNGCLPVQLVAPPTQVYNGLSQEAIHLHPFMPATDTRVSLIISNGPKTLQLEADLRDTVDQIKKRIMEERKFGGLGSFGLLYGSRELQGPETLVRQNVKDQATLFIVHKCNGG